MKNYFTINGEKFHVDISTLPVDITLNTFIREHAGLTATKFMCQEGGCGVCVCVVTGKHPATGEVRTWAVNSCLTLLNSCTDWAIVTSEGIGNKRQGYHAIQKRLAKMNGTQCGYCSPGFVMNMYALMEASGGKLTMEEIENSFGGNICRCTGYRPILDAMKSFAVDSNIEIPAECRDIEDLSTKNCPKTGAPCNGICTNGVTKRLSMKFSDGSQWFWTESLEDIFEAFAKLGANEKYMLVAGNTAHGVYRRSADIKNFIDINAVSELSEHQLTDCTLTLGANLTLTETMEIFKDAAKKSGFEYCQLLWNHFDLIANVPVRNMGTLAGNLLIKHQNREFPSDVFVTFEALDVTVVLNVSAKELIKVSLLEFFETPMQGKIVNSFVLKAYPSDHYIFDSYKIMPRAQNAHAYVNAAFLARVQKPSHKVLSARICFGGIHPDFTHATDVEEFLVGKSLFDKQVVAEIFRIMSQNIKPDAILPDASPEYRYKLVHGLFYKFLLAHSPQVSKKLQSGAHILKRLVSSGKQVFETIESNYPITQPTEKHEGLIQTAGEAIYSNDLPKQPFQLWAAFVTAKKIGATIINADATAALKLPGVVAFFTAKDIPGKNTMICHEPQFFSEKEELFLTGTIKFYNQPIGVIVAESNALANRAADLVEISYEGSSDKVMSSLHDVLESSAMDRITTTHKSPIEELVINDSFDVYGSGKLELGLQYHFFMEPHTTVVVPFEGGLQVYAAAQWMDLVQVTIADVLNLRANEVQVNTRRLGGGFGGKATRSGLIAGAAALAAYKLNRPVRFVQSLESMMNIMGKRWPCHVDYDFYAKRTGKIVALRSTFFEGAGYSANDSPIWLTEYLSQNCYQFCDNYKLDGNLVITDAPSNTAMRSPGSVEAIAMMENIIEHIAFESGLDPLEVRLANLVPGHKMTQMLPYFVESAQYKERRMEINQFNLQNRWRKKGLGMGIMVYPMDYFGIFPATVAIYHGDGTVIVTHGGIEMGQGMNTKIAQVVAFTLGIPLDMIKFQASNTINGANSMTTGASIGSESVCYAVRKCCNTINERFKPIREKLQNPTWLQLVSKAHNEKVNLIASDACKQGDMDTYHICALALNEVEVDLLTGNYQITRVDILEDAGESLNPNVDVGQIEGAFIQGLGYWTSEQCVVDKRTGELLTNRTWNYKPPGAKDIPIDFRIELLAQSANPAGFMRSKGTGEPAICLGVTVAFALQHALQSARDDAGLKKAWIPLNAPMTPEHVLLSAGTEVSMFTL